MMHEALRRVAMSFTVEKMEGESAILIQFHNERGSIVITDNPAVKMAMQGMNSEIYGNVVIPVFEAIDEALAYVHQQIDKP
jgi:hypothetical protein